MLQLKDRIEFAGRATEIGFVAAKDRHYRSAARDGCARMRDVGELWSNKRTRSAERRLPRTIVRNRQRP